MNKYRSPDDIALAWKNIEERKPGIRIREAATSLALSEAQLLATKVGSGVTRLEPRWDEFLKRLPQLGRIMSLTRNHACVLEHMGSFEKISMFGEGDHHMATVIGSIETRVFLKSWHVAFAVQQEKGEQTLASLQVFDHGGDAITKIYLRENSNYNAYEALVTDFKAANQDRQQEVFTYEKKEYTKTIDKEDFLQEWAALKDTHDFYPLLNKHKIRRHDAIEVAEGKFSYAIDVVCIQRMLEKAARQKLPIMIFVGNRGNLQIHQDRVRTIRLLERGHTGEEKWLNVLDPIFNMHLRIDLIQTVWVVTKPTSDGNVTSIECYDADRELTVQFFGLRKPGEPEMIEWRALVNALDTMDAKL